MGVAKASCGALPFHPIVQHQQVTVFRPDMHAEKLPDAEVRGDDHAPMRCRAIEQPARPSQEAKARSG
jgi:hypothetical protein